MLKIEVGVTEQTAYSVGLKSCGSEESFHALVRVVLFKSQQVHPDDDLAIFSIFQHILTPLVYIIELRVCFLAIFVYDGYPEKLVAFTKLKGGFADRLSLL